MKFSAKEFKIEAIIQETEKQKKLNKSKIKNYFEKKDADNHIRKYFLNLRLNENSFCGKIYKKYFDCCFSEDNIEDYIYFKQKASKVDENVLKKNKLFDQSGFLFGISSYPRIGIGKLAKLSYGRKLFVFIMMSFISYMVLFISRLLREKEKQEL